jgi:hypothetical protein
MVVLAIYLVDQIKKLPRFPESQPTPQSVTPSQPIQDRLDKELEVMFTNLTNNNPQEVVRIYEGKIKNRGLEGALRRKSEKLVDALNELSNRLEAIEKRAWTSEDAIKLLGKENYEASTSYGTLKGDLISAEFAHDPNVPTLSKTIMNEIEIVLGKYGGV